GQFLLTAEPYLAAKNVKSDPVNSYSSSPYIRPKLMGESLYFTEDSGAYASVREYFIDDLSVTGDAADVTAHVPKLMPGRMRAMASA
ncbi:phage nozzle protein, partial [Enterobacter hormaechei]